MKKDLKKMKVVTVVGTRPEIIRLSRVVCKLDQYCDHKIIHTGQNYDYELNEIFYKDLSLRKPDYFLNAAGNSSSETIGNVIIETEKVLDEINPEALLVLGDTNSCLSVLPAKRKKIPTFHMEAGNRCFDMRVPEEINRKIVDHIADCNLCYSDISREYLISEGLSPDLIIKTGSPMFEVLNYYKKEIAASKILDVLKLTNNNFFVVSAHREENIDSDKNFSNLIEILNTLSKIYNYPIIVSTHPRTQKRLDDLKIRIENNINFIKPLGFFDYNKLQLSAKTVLSDSGTISEESSILNFSALNIREAHERPESMEEAVVIMTGLDKEKVIQGIEILDKQSKISESRIVSDYSMPDVSDKVVKIIHSYTDYINRVIWKKY